MIIKEHKKMYLKHLYSQFCHLDTTQNKKASSYRFIYLWALPLLLWVLPACIPLPSEGYGNSSTTSNTKTLRYETYIYENNIKTIQINTQNTTQGVVVQSGAISLQQFQPAVLSFDVLEASNERFRAKIIHCDRNWKPSPLNVIEYLNDFNDFIIQENQISFNTKVPYTHYTWTLPKVKISGNYLLKVYRDGDENDLIFTYRLIVYENLVSLKPKIVASNIPSAREQTQQLEFELDYQGFQILNPQEEIKVVVRQNYRWDNALTDLKVLNLREFAKKIEYRAFEGENTFLGGNEFRRFEIKSIRFLGFRIDQLNTTGPVNAALVEADQTRADRSYARQPDLNGFFEIDRYESEVQNEIEADYLSMTFRLRSDYLGEATKVYVIGAYNLWNALPENQMKYDLELGEYRADILMKQGSYNYMYATKEGEQPLSLSTFEGNFQATENFYDILVYYRPQGQRHEQIIGYMTFNSDLSR